MLELDELWSFAGGKATPLWLWVALCRRTRQIVAWMLRDPSLQSAYDLRADLPADYRRCATRSDYWDAYATAFPKRTHCSCGKEEGETCHVERFFGTLRARLSRLVRRAYSFSKCAEHHAQDPRLKGRAVAALQTYPDHQRNRRRFRLSASGP